MNDFLEIRKSKRKSKRKSRKSKRKTRKSRKFGKVKECNKKSRKATNPKYICNKKTGRWILIGGKTYNELKK